MIQNTSTMDKVVAGKLLHLTVAGKPKGAGRQNLRPHAATVLVGTSDHSRYLPVVANRKGRRAAPYFSVNSSGNVTVRPHGERTMDHQEIDLLKVVKKASDSKSTGGLDLQLPIIVRFPDVLKDRLESLQSAFNYAVKSQGYSSHYQGVYPVKCNQDRFIVEDIVRFGSSFRFGLEAGSKPELLLAMSSLCKGSSESLLICNGFKDSEYISLALIARKLSLNTVIVLEQEEELDSIIDISVKLGVRPAPFGFPATVR
ncbi:hypothetical protein SSX86_025668 [Deinandra increscens subsp. villosa]|uniref:Arginine decarboxylase n=1 Tax=Deinandra increscens subsp. villosa TaxID=3103831 RepID=A0AAP0CD36_9ASTR